MDIKFKNVTAVRIFSQDIQKSRDWYRALLNIEPIEDLETFVSFKIGNTCLDIALADTKNPCSTGGTVAYWLVDKIDAVLERVETLGGKLYRGPLRVQEIQRTIMQIQDPYGNILGFEAPF